MVHLRVNTQLETSSSTQVEVPVYYTDNHIDKCNVLHKYNAAEQAKQPTLVVFEYARVCEWDVVVFAVYIGAIYTW